jgi:hypothetical protein|tara:strand:- start:1224 stop:1367 length:144 start_codon:yes stop_codon:yes gene_type:complete
MSSRNLKRVIYGKMLKGEDINFLIAPLTPKLKYEVLVYVEKKENDRQ